MKYHLMILTESGWYPVLAGYCDTQVIADAMIGYFQQRYPSRTFTVHAAKR